MKICHISDTHGVYFKKLNPGDILIHSGDGLLFGDLNEIHRFAAWFAEQDYKVKIFVPGNHDKVFQDMSELCEAMMKKVGVTVLINRAIDLRTQGYPLNIWGSPYTPEFNNWSFMLPEHKLEALWDTIPRDTDIVVTHGPPYSVLDNCRNPDDNIVEYAGSESLLYAIQRIKPRFHLFGHIHVARGTCYATLDTPTHFFNSSLVNDELNVVSEPTYLEYEENEKDYTIKYP